MRSLLDTRGGLPRIGDDDEGTLFQGEGTSQERIGSVLAALAALRQKPEIAPIAVRPQMRQALFGALTGAAAPSGVRHFPKGGYTVAREHTAAGEALLVFDDGPLGYLSIAAHVHADALSVWLHVDGRPVLIDAGTLLYHASDGWWDHFRGTAAQNTLSIDGRDSSQVAGPFNWSAKAQARVVGQNDGEGWWVEAEHDGYVADYGYRHRRRVERRAAGIFHVIDSLVGVGGVERVEVGFLIAPELEVATAAGGWVVQDRGRRLLYLRHEGPLKGWLERGLETPKRGWYSPSFGLRQPAPRICFAGKMWPGVSATFILSVRG